MARWEEVIDHQVDLYRFWRSEIGQQYAEGYLKSIMQAPYLDEGDRKAARILHGDIPTRAASFLYEAEPIWIDPDMMTLVEAAAASFQPEPLHPNDLITDCGFVYLPRPITIVDVWGKALSYRAISWKVVNFTYRIDEDDKVVDEAKQGLFLFLYHQRGDPDAYEDEDQRLLRESRVHLPALTLAHSTPWVFGQTYFDGTGEDEARVEAGVLNPEALHGTKNIAQYIGALFRLLTQTIAIRTPMRPSRAFRKRQAPLPGREVVVVTLRRRREDSYPADRGDEPVEWSHRWLVSGHWRNQWFPSLNLHRQVWISPYIKGPDDKPLVIRPLRVFKFAR